MTFDELRRTWQSQQGVCKLNIDSDILLKEVKRNKKWFEAAVFWRDVREVGVAFIMFVFFLYCGLEQNIWSLILLALLVLGIGAFMVVDRFSAKRKHPKFNGTLISCIESSLAEIKHQIWLLKNVLWWYLLPLGIGIAVFIIHIIWETLRTFSGKHSVYALVFLSTYLVCCTLFFWFIYWLNQRAVRKELLPRKVELEGLLDSLSLTENPEKATERG